MTNASLRIPGARFSDEKTAEIVLASLIATYKNSAFDFTMSDSA